MSVESNFKKWLEEMVYTDDERKFAEDFDSNSTRAMAFFAGDRAARVEILEKLLGGERGHVRADAERMLSELKGGA